MIQNGDNMDLNKQKEMLLKRKQALLDYMQSCINIEDFHGVCDAGMDLREVNLELDLINKWYPTLTFFDPLEDNYKEPLITHYNNYEKPLCGHDWLSETDHILSSIFDNVNCKKCLKLK